MFYLSITLFFLACIFRQLFNLAMFYFSYSLKSRLDPDFLSERYSQFPILINSFLNTLHMYLQDRVFL